MALIIGMSIFGLILLGALSLVGRTIWEDERKARERQHEHNTMVDQLVQRIDAIEAEKERRQHDDETFWELVNSHNWVD